MPRLTHVGNEIMPYYLEIYINDAEYNPIENSLQSIKGSLPDEVVILSDFDLNKIEKDVADIVLDLEPKLIGDFGLERNEEQFNFIFLSEVSPLFVSKAIAVCQLLSRWILISQELRSQLGNLEKMLFFFYMVQFAYLIAACGKKRKDHDYIKSLRRCVDLFKNLKQKIIDTYDDLHKNVVSLIIFSEYYSIKLSDSTVNNANKQRLIQFKGLKAYSDAMKHKLLANITIFKKRGITFYGFRCIPENETVLIYRSYSINAVILDKVDFWRAELN